MPTSTSTKADTRIRLVGWTAILAPVLGWANIILLIVLQGGDMELLLRPAEALALPGSAQQLFVLAMVLDTFGFYLAFFIVGAYLWAQLRPQFGVIIDMATLALVAYIVLGVAGAMIPAVVLPQLSALHASGDAAMQSAAEASWLTVIYASHHALWGTEGPVMAFWGWVIGRSLHASGARYGRILMLTGVLYGAFFACMVLGLAELQGLLTFAAVTVLPVWAVLTGIDLLRQARLAENSNAD
jgi:hypothetical protein